MTEARDFAADRAMCEAASKGPWRAHNLIGNLPIVVSDQVAITDRVFNGLANAEFIAAAREGWSAALREIERLRLAIERQSREIEQTLGAALNYHLAYPEVSEVDDGSVCVGEHTAETLASEAAREVERLRAEVLHLSNRLRDAPLGGHGSHWEGCWKSHIDCARAEVERLREDGQHWAWAWIEADKCNRKLRAENIELRAALDAAEREAALLREEVRR